MTPRVLVTGGAGFVGRHLVRLLLSRGWPVRVLDLPGVPLDDVPVRGLEVVRGDVRDASAVHHAVQGCHWVLHLAAIPDLWAPQPGAFHGVNVRGTCNVLEACARWRVRRVVHVSTESILARPGQDDLIDERATPALADMVGAYCRSKFRAEQEARRAARRGTPVTIVNPTVPVGPGDRQRCPPSRMIVDFACSRIGAVLDGQLNLVDVRDVAQGIILAAERGRVGRRYILGAENWGLADVFGTLADLTGRPVPRYRVPYPVALAYAALAEGWATCVSHRPPMATVAGVRLTRRRMHFDNTRAVHELGLRPAPVTDALADAVTWFRQQGMIPQP